MLKLGTAVLALAAPAYAALQAPGSTYKDPATGLTWGFLSESASQTLAQKVPQAYTLGYRPASAKEFAAVTKSDPAFGSNTGYVFAGSDSFAASPVTGAASDPVASNSNAADATGVWGVKMDAADCPADVGILVNAIDLYGGITITDAVNDGCMCNSQRSGGLCTTLTTATGCLNSTVANQEANTGQQVLGGGVVDGSTESVLFNITSPQVKTRNMTSFNWGNCDNKGTANGGLSSYQTTTQQSSCDDQYLYGFRVSELVSACGLTKQNAPTAGDTTWPAAYANGFVRYRGDFMIYYKEWVNVSNVLLTRTGRLVTPIDLYINRTASAELTTQTSITASSPFELQAAITATTVKRSATTDTMTVTFGIKAPYEVLAIDSAGDGFGDGAGGNSNTLPHQTNNGKTDIADACILGGVANMNTAACTPNPDFTTDSGLAPCTKADYDPATGFCWRNVTILITNGAACSLDHTIRIPVISVYCSAAYPSGDCPLGPTSASADNSTGISVTIRADSFCDGDRALVINGAITIQSYVPQRQLTRANDKNVVRAYQYAETVYLLLTINQTASLKVFNLTPTSFTTKIDGGSYQKPPQADARMKEATDAITDANGVKLGWDTPTQTFAHLLRLSNDAVVDAQGNALLTGNPSGQLFAQLIFNVDYDTARRRRRTATVERQAGAPAKGQAAMESQFSVAPSSADVSANSNSASALSSGRLVAFATALLCGAALLF